MFTFGDIDPMEGAFDSQFTDLTRLAQLPEVTQAAAAAGQEAPAMATQRMQAKPRRAAESLRDVYRTGRDKSAASNPEEDRKPFKWSDLSSDQKSDMLLRFGLSLMENSPTAVGLSGFGKAGADALGYFDEIREKNREDAKGRRKESADEGMRLAQLTGMDADNAARDRQIDQADRQVLPGADGYTLADLASGTSTTIRDEKGEAVLPASTGRDSVFQQKYDLGIEIAQERGLTGTKAKQFASDYAAANRTHVDPRTYISARDQVMETYLPNGRPSRELRDLMKTTGKTAEEIINAQTDELLSNYQNQHGYGLSDVAGAASEEETNPFLIQQ